MSKLAAMKLRLTPVAQMVQANIGDAFNIDALAQLFVKWKNLTKWVLSFSK